MITLFSFLIASAFADAPGNVKTAMWPFCYDAVAKGALKTAKKVFEIENPRVDRFQFSIRSVSPEQSLKIKNRTVFTYGVSGDAYVGGYRSGSELWTFDANVYFTAEKCTVFKVELLKKFDSKLP